MAEAALEVGGPVDLCLPWDTFSRDWVRRIRDRFGSLVQLEPLLSSDEEAFHSVQAFHPNPDALKRNGLRLHARNYRILHPIGGGLVRCVVAAPRNNSGGTMQGVRIAETLQVPVVRLDLVPAMDVKRWLDKRLGMKKPKGATLLQAQRHVQEALKPGAGAIDCPCCKQRVQLYRRRLNSEMARWLILLSRVFLSNGRRWVSVKDSPLKETRGGDYAKLQHWGLIEQRPNTDEKKRTSGYWRPTTKGVNFAKNRTRVPSHIYIFNNTVYGQSEETVSIVDALGVKFDYRDVVRTALKSNTKEKK